ncbi:hypothetical protein AMTR_s00033p00077840 [Amborella trichopoda]|uniref:Tunicamycin induced 1 n=2 Tax=Amborella trichopoda TaxID=13333 RepID=U5CW73_AMBTC|nr:hypothetical protein AMTR_s00033p00077840 [Amborella trichopoda]
MVVRTKSMATPESPNSSPMKVMADLKEAIVRGLGFQPDEFKVSSIDFKDAMVGQTVVYEFMVEIDNKVIPLKFLEDTRNWESVDLPFLRSYSREESENSLATSRSGGLGPASLAPFQLAGPMELWIQDGKDMRLSLPHDVEAGVLKKVNLADGAVVTVQGARAVSLRQPLQFPLPLSRSTTHKGQASALLSLANLLKEASQTKDQPLVSLRIVGPTSLTSPSSLHPHTQSKLRVKKLAPGAIELISRPQESNYPLVESGASLGSLSSQDKISSYKEMWPLTSVNGSDPKLKGFEHLLFGVLGEKAREEGSFKLLEAKASAETFVKVGLKMEKALGEGEEIGFLPEWRTKPSSLKLEFEVLARLEGESIVPERVTPVQPVLLEDTVASWVRIGNVSMSKLPIIHPPSSPFTL